MLNDDASSQKTLTDPETGKKKKKKVTHLRLNSLSSIFFIFSHKLRREFFKVYSFGLVSSEKNAAGSSYVSFLCFFVNS